MNNCCQANKIIDTTYLASPLQLEPKLLNIHSPLYISPHTHIHGMNHHINYHKNTNNRHDLTSHVSDSIFALMS